MAHYLRHGSIFRRQMLHLRYWRLLPVPISDTRELPFTSWRDVLRTSIGLAS